MKSLDDFHRNRRNRDGRTSYCKPCACASAKAHREGRPEHVAQLKRDYYEKNRDAIVAYKKEWAERNREANKKRLRNWQLVRNYGITLEEWEALFESQGRSCAACGTQEETKRGWVTDHCHETGRVRGILCHHCNVALGYAKDSPQVLLRLHAYLTR